MGKKGWRTRERIIATCLQLFSQKGYFNTSINDILDAAGITRGCLYGHFRSKEEIWQASYEEAGRIWRDLVLKGVDSINDPLERLEKTIQNDMEEYIGRDTFEGGCFFLNMLVEFSGQSATLSTQVLRGFQGFADVVSQWLKEAEAKKLLRSNLDHEQIVNFIILSLNGAAAFYAATKNPCYWTQTAGELRRYIRGLRGKSS
jgi:TetR/AcrR family transcriptional repressor of nem operon